jgi:hypothetical protein
VLTAVGVSSSNVAKALDLYKFKGGRTIDFTAHDRKGILLVAKHENSLAYNYALEWSVNQATIDNNPVLRSRACPLLSIPARGTIVIMVDAISRRYYTSEASWLWDIDFDILDDDSVGNIVLVGRYVNELGARFAMTGVNPDKISYVQDYRELPEHLKLNTSGDIYAMTCFADKSKFMSVFQK